MALLDFLQPNNSGKKKSQNEALNNTLLSLSDVIAPSAINISPRNINISGVFARVYYAVSYPRYLSDGWMEPVLNLSQELDVTNYIHPTDTKEMLKKFQKKVAEVQSQINIKAERGEVRDPELEAGYRNLEDMRDRLQQGEEKMFGVGFYVSVYGENEAEINKAENDIRGILDSRLITLKPALFQQEQGFKSVLPLANDELMVNSKFNSEPLSSFFPFTSFDLTSDTGILYGINRHNSSLVLFDRYSLTNYNSVTFATSGAGKSYALKLEILRSLMFGTEVIVIDPEHEYEYLAEATGGRFFNISLSSDHHVNPFDLPNPAEDEDPRDVLRTHVIELVGLFRLMLGGLTAEEETVIDIAIQETYALKDITGDTNFAEQESPLLADFEMVLAGMEGSSSLITRLQKYTAGTWAGFMNEPTNVDINQKFVVFSLRDMEDELKTIAMYIITNFIWGSVRRRLAKRLMVIDEAWWMMKSEDTASFLFSMAKRGRKYYLGIATITQDVDDFLRSPYGVPMITNSSIQLLMKQSPTAIDNIQKTFNLTDEEKFLLLESSVGEGIFFAGLKHVAIKIIASYTEDQIITSDPSQILQIKKAREELQASRG